MILEEYCSYILSREKNLQDFTIPGTNITIDKNKMLTSMRETLRDVGGLDYDKLLVNTLMCYVNKDNIEKSSKFDDKMEAVYNNIRQRVERISVLYNSLERSLPFSYERVFEILVYYLRIKTNILKSGKEKTVRYTTGDISLDAVINILNPKLSADKLVAEWEKKGWKAFYIEAKPLSFGMAENYFKLLVLATYIRYCEIKAN